MTRYEHAINWRSYLAFLNNYPDFVWVDRVIWGSLITSIVLIVLALFHPNHKTHDPNWYWRTRFPGAKCQVVCNGKIYWGDAAEFVSDGQIILTSGGSALRLPSEQAIIELKGE